MLGDAAADEADGDANSKIIRLSLIWTLASTEFLLCACCHDNNKTVITYFAGLILVDTHLMSPNVSLEPGEWLSSKLPWLNVVKSVMCVCSHFGTLILVTRRVSCWHKCHNKKISPLTSLGDFCLANRLEWKIVIKHLCVFVFTFSSDCE